MTTDSKLNLGQGYWNIGMGAYLGGSVIAQIGAYSEAVGQEMQLDTSAISADHQAVMDGYGAAQARLAAQSVVQEGRRERGRYGLRAAQEQGAERASAAARGVQLGAGSAAEVQASLKYAQAVDQLTIDSNTLRQRQALDRQALSLRNRAEMNRVSAINLRDMKSAVSPGLAAATQALRSVSASAMGFAQRYS